MAKEDNEKLKAVQKGIRESTKHSEYETFIPKSARKKAKKVAKPRKSLVGKKQKEYLGFPVDSDGEVHFIMWMEELKQNGYICVAVMAESQSGYVISGIENVVYIPMHIKNTAKPGQVYQAVNDVWIYNEGNAPDRSTQTYLKTTNVPLPIEIET